MVGHNKWEEIEIGDRGRKKVPVSQGARSIRKYRIQIQHNIKCRMQDGTELATDVYMPIEGGPFPTIVTRTPYDKYSELTIEEWVHRAQQGYAIVTQDVRGRYESQGKFYPMRNEVSDGADCIDWVSQQPWCNGMIGTVGGSYVGLTQWQAAQNSSKIVCSVPQVSYSNLYHNWIYTGGAFQLAFNTSWGIATGSRGHQRQYLSFPDEISQATLFRHLPLATIDERSGRKIPHLRDWINHPSYDDYWKEMHPIEDHYQNVEMAAYHMGGWFDVFLQGGLNNFMGVSAKGKTEHARKGQKIIIGPWIHSLGDNGTSTKTGDVDFGETSLIDLEAEKTRWYDYWLKGIENGIMDEPRIKLFVMGSNRWRESEDWPLPETEYTPYYFDSRGNANSVFGDGSLVLNCSESSKPDQYIYDPEHPVMTIGGSTCCADTTVAASLGPQDQRPNEYRPDVLVYTTPPLEHDLEVTGPVRVVLYAATNVRDTDFTAKLVDVYPSGYAMNVAQGIQRARYRDSWTNPTLLEPGEIYQYSLDLWSTSNCFLKGHAIRVEISSSNFPQFDRNPNTGNPFGQDSDLIKAKQTIYHNREYPSHIMLPVIP